MSDTTTKVSGRTACIAAIRAAGKPLTANEIASAIVEAGVVPTLAGKTPKATLSAQVTSAAKKGETFRKVGDGRPARFDVIDGVPDSPPDLVEALKAQVNRPVSDAVEDVTAGKTEDAPEAAAEPEAEVKEAKPDPKKPEGKSAAGRRRSRAAKETANA